MKIFKILILVLFSINTSAVSAAAITFDNGNFQFITSTFIDNDTVGQDTRGIGQVQIISQNGSTIWTSGDNGNYLNYVFDDFATVTSTAIPGQPGAFNYSTSGGFVDFYLTNDVSLFDVSSTFSDVVTALMTSSLYLSTVAEGPVFGVNSPTIFNANGFLNVTGGTDSIIFDTNSILAGAGLFADLTFNISADNINTQGVNNVYDYSGSADLNGLITNVPITSTLYLSLIGLAILGLSRKSYIS